MSVTSPDANAVFRGPDGRLPRTPGWLKGLMNALINKYLRTKQFRLPQRKQSYKRRETSEGKNISQQRRRGRDSRSGAEHLELMEKGKVEGGGGGGGGSGNFSQKEGSKSTCMGTTLC